METDGPIHDTLAIAIALFAVAYTLWLLVRRLARSRPGLRLGGPVALALALRLLAIPAVTILGAEALRGADELGFLANAQSLADGTGGGAWLDALGSELHLFVSAVTIDFLDPPYFAVRAVHAGIATAGLALAAAAVHDLAGPRAGRIAMLVLAVEPTNIFFSGVVHKESLMMLAGGLVALGGARAWVRGDHLALLPIVLGCLIAVATRSYAAWFLISASVVILLLTGARTAGTSGRAATGLTMLAVAFALFAAPTVIDATSEESLERNLQGSQDANTSDDSNLGLERVDFSSREAILANLPVRIRDVLLRPYPWQLDNRSQQFGLIGTIVLIVGLVLLARAPRRPSDVLRHAGPLLIIGLLLLVAYSLSAGNAGTAFRYRTHVVEFVLVAFVAIRFASPAWRSEPSELPRPADPRRMRAALNPTT